MLFAAEEDNTKEEKSEDAIYQVDFCSILQLVPSPKLKKPTKRRIEDSECDSNPDEIQDDIDLTNHYQPNCKEMTLEGDATIMWMRLIYEDGRREEEEKREEVKRLSQEEEKRRRGGEREGEKREKTLMGYALGSAEKIDQSSLNRQRRREHTEATKEGSEAEEKNQKRYEWLKDIRDANKRRPGEAGYDPTTLYIPDSAWKDMTPSKKQFWEIKRDHFDVIIFFQQGAFYNVIEMDADVCHKQLGFAYTHGVNRPVNNYGAGCMTGQFPRFAYALMDMGYKVAKVDQVDTNRSGNKALKKKLGKEEAEQRFLDRIFSVGEHKTIAIPLTGTGTITDDRYLPKSSQYLLALHESDDGRSIGFCLLDASIAEFSLGRVGESRGASDRYRYQLETLLLQSNPREVVLDRKMKSDTMRFIKSCMNNASFSTIDFPSHHDVRDDLARLQIIHPDGEEPPGIKRYKEDESIMTALGGCITYLRDARIHEQLLAQRNIRDHSQFHDGSSLLLGGQVLKSLEILETNKGETEGTLLDFMDRTNTAFGSRMMRKWICHPLRWERDINDRLDAVSCMMSHPPFTDRLLLGIRKLPDLERKLSSLKGNPTLSSFLPLFLSFRQLIILLDEKMESKLLHQLVTPTDETVPLRFGTLSGLFPHHVAQLWSSFEAIIDENSTETELKVKPGSSQELTVVMEEYKHREEALDNYLARFRKKYCKGNSEAGKWITDKTLGERCIEVSKKDVKITDLPKSTRTREMKNTIRLVTTELDEIFTDWSKSKEQVEEMNEKIIFGFSSKFLETSDVWYELIRIVSTLDCLHSHSVTSKVLSGCRPILEPREEPYLSIKRMVHPCLNYGSRSAVPNDLIMGGEQPEIILLTGPNMGGKSTVLRSACVTVIMAQVGCHVSAEQCRMTAVDRIFTRLGANDHIMENQSTFMMELNETESILRHSTRHSLVILDELGRGTSTFDGYSIAYSVLSHFSAVSSLRLLFATHYHLLTEEFKSQKNVAMYQMMTTEGRGRDIFTYKFLPGVCPKSYGMNVASMAGISDQIVRRAEEIAVDIESKSRSMLGNAPTGRITSGCGRT
ncbi:DNA mismatch repair protein msh6 [Planoprotostelium fungivorum]|uniref:DNA mismatch repair protein msh6 n=1 Tax=Planoprotostelium fungivorum TaxID=1890364 RepID=A0A2P6N4T5_9EUKA|nr:DNA mismatch repair protein msh6 [Planoprotostelium fungivorum]